MVLTDDNFATIVKTIDYGRAIYDNLAKYIRFQMGMLAAFIFSYLGAALFDIGDRIVGTTRITGEQWLVCIVFAFGMLLIDEVIKFFMRRRGE